MDPLVELPELAKARIKAREAEADAHVDQIRQEVEGELARAERDWDGSHDLHRGELDRAREEARAGLQKAAQISAEYVFLAHATEYRTRLPEPGELAPLLASLREAVIGKYGEHTRSSVQNREAQQLDVASAERSHIPDNAKESSPPVLVGDARFWKQRQREFREYNSGENESLSADWDSLSNEWSLQGTAEAQSIFKSLATLAAKGFQTWDRDAPWRSWLEELRRQRRNYQESPFTAAYSQSVMADPARFGFQPPTVIGELESGRVNRSEIEELFGPENAKDKADTFVQACFQGVHGRIKCLFACSAHMCLEFESQVSGDSCASKAAPTSDSESQQGKPSEKPIQGDTELDRPQHDQTDAEIAKRSRAATVAKLINELNTLKPQMFEDESEYEKLRKEYPNFLTFQIAAGRPDLKLKLLAIQGSTRHIRLAQELAAAYHGRELSTIQDDWKDYKPEEFKRSKSRTWHP